MSLHFLLDGYNIIKQIPELAPKKLEEGRLSLVRLIETHQPQGSLHNNVTIVFDGQPGIWGKVSSSRVKVIFTETESADDKIKSLVEDSSFKKNIVVVTDDKDIKFAVRRMGATVIGVQEFWSRIQSKSASPKLFPKQTNRRDRKDKEEEKIISKTLEYKITSEFEKLWLGNGDKKKRDTLH